MVKVECYSGAIIRLATFQKDRGQPGRLLFATVTLLTHGRQLPAPSKKLDRHNLRHDGGTVYFRKIVADVEPAVNWYRSLAPGITRTPIPSRAEEIVQGIDDVEIDVSSFEDDPVWPHLGLPMGESIFAQPSGRDDPAPFLGSVAARVHRRFGSTEGFDAVLADETAVVFLARRLHINLRDYAEYLGSVALVVPDPVLQRVEHFMIPASERDGERIFYRFVPRRGQRLTGLHITTFDEEAHLLTGFTSHDVPDDGVLIADKGSCTGSYGYVVTHADHGVLMYSPPASFIRQVSVDMSVSSSREVNVSVPLGDSANSGRMSYRVPNRAHTVTTRKAGDPPFTKIANVRVGVAAAKRLQKTRAASAGQRWFGNGTREDAMRFVQAEIGRARTRVIVADPYFGGLQIGQFLYAAAFDGVKFTLITSGLAFRSRGGRTRSEILDDFRERLEKLASDVKVSPEVFVLNSSVLHDRFLVIDNVVWFLGNSLNALGEKSSLIAKVPDPDDVIRRLEEMLGTAIPLDSYVQSGKEASEESEE